MYEAMIPFRRRSAAACAVVFAAGMTAFTFLDLPVAKAVFQYNEALGEIFKVIGILPTCITGMFFAASNLCTLKAARLKKLSVLFSVLSLVLFCGFTLLSIYNLNKLFFVPLIIFFFCFFPLSVLINLKLRKKYDVLNIRKVMLAALISALVAVLGQTVIKMGFNRPRFVSLTDPDTQFRFWFVHYPLAADSGFPSGHASQAALSFLLLRLKDFDIRFRKRKWNIAFTAAALFITAGTMLARMFLGAHYATDVWAGAFLTLAAIACSHYFIERHYSLPR